jgi:hypothetical protein
VEDCYINKEGGGCSWAGKFILMIEENKTERAMGNRTLSSFRYFSISRIKNDISRLDPPLRRIF